MLTTKQKRRYAIDLPQEAMDVLRWHVHTQLKTPEQKDSDLLFPAVNGKLRSPSVLNKPLADVATELRLGKTITQRALRRTFNDLARAVQVNDLVTRSISGHLTERMQHPRARPQLVKLSPDVERHLREAIEESEREGYADMSAEETDLYLETGELPEHVKTWAASCNSRRAT